MSAPLRLAMLGMIPGNGHPYSWSAIINGYDPEAMAGCPYPVIPQYLGAQRLEEVCIPNAKVTHIWTDNPAEAPLVARAAKIDHVVGRIEEVIGHVDGVIIATDDGGDHVRRARPFIEAGLPVFVDKPLATTREELAQFIAWKRAGARIHSSSGMRYSPAFNSLRGKEWRWIALSNVKRWDTYGIHSLEPLFTLLGPGFLEARSIRTGEDLIVHLTHRCGTLSTISILPGAGASFGAGHAFGDAGHLSLPEGDTYSSFRAQLLAVIDWMRHGTEPFPFCHTVEMMAVVIAAMESDAAAGSPVAIPPLLESIQRQSEAYS